MFPVQPTWTLDGISLRGKDPRVMGHQSSVGHTQTQFVPPYPQHGPRKPISVPGCYIITYYFLDSPKGSGYGSRSRTRLIDGDLGDPGVCLCHYTIDRGSILVGYSGYAYVILPMGNDTI